MARQSVSVRGERIFSWEGGKADAADIEIAAAELAQSVNVSAEDLAVDAVESLIEIGPLDGDAGTMQQVGVLHYLFSKPTNQPGYPGPFRDYVGEWSFGFDLDMVGSRVHVKVTADRVVHG